ncbi:hypothetical protein G6F31_020408 [Rhizopus arrhizus]|nr:hypothetical protein G6F31_020408 [Rhizopus arrhizus]
MAGLRSRCPFSAKAPPVAAAPDAHRASRCAAKRWPARAAGRAAILPGDSSVPALRSRRPPAGCASRPGRGRRHSAHGSILPDCRRAGSS